MAAGVPGCAATRRQGYTAANIPTSKESAP